VADACALLLEDVDAEPPEEDETEEELYGLVDIAPLFEVDDFELLLLEDEERLRFSTSVFCWVEVAVPLISDSATVFVFEKDLTVVSPSLEVCTLLSIT